MSVLGDAWKHYQPMARRLIAEDARLCRRIDKHERDKILIALTFACVANWLEGWDPGWQEARAAIDAHDAARQLLRRAQKRVARFPYASGLIDLVLTHFPNPPLPARPQRGRGRPRKEWQEKYESALRSLGATRDEARALLSEVAREVAADPNKPAQPTAR